MMGPSHLEQFAVESAICTKFGIKHVAVTMYDNNRILVAECTNSQLDKLEEIKSEIGIDIVLKINKIPLDVRHHSKIDYNILKSYVEKELVNSK